MTELVDIYIIDSHFVVITDDPSYIEDYLKLYGPNTVETISMPMHPQFQRMFNEKKIKPEHFRDFLERNRDLLSPELDLIQDLVWTEFDGLFDTNENPDGYAFIWNTSKGLSKIVDTNDFNDLGAILDTFENFKLVKVYKGIENTIIHETNNFLQTKHFNSFDDLLDSIEAIEKLFAINQPETENEFVDVLRDYFVITGDARDRIKCSVVYNQFERLFPDVSKTKLKKVLLELLSSWKVFRKRFSDGYSFTGIKHNNESETIIARMELNREIELRDIFGNF